VILACAFFAHATEEANEVDVVEACGAASSGGNTVTVQPTQRHTHAAHATTSTASASSRCGGTKGTPAYKGPCCPVGSGHKGNLYNALLREAGGLQAGGAEPSKWINVCNTPTASSNTGFSAYLFFVAEDSGGNNVVKQCNYQTGDNLNLGTSGRMLLKGSCSRHLPLNRSPF